LYLQHRELLYKATVCTSIVGFGVEGNFLHIQRMELILKATIPPV